MKTKGFFLFLIVCTLLLGVEHVHDEYCGYNETTQTGCIYEVNTIENNHPGK